MIDIKEWKAEGKNRMYGIDDTLEALGYAWNGKTNIMLYGNPGYGKTFAAELFGNYLLGKGEISSPIFLKSLHQATTEEELLGGLNVKKYKDEGELVYLLEKSFIEHDYVILDEMLNAYLGVIGVLNDILVSGKVRQGSSSSWVPIKTKLVVACTNKTREEVAIDPTTAAIMERFPMECLTQWTSHTYQDYLNMLQLTPEGKMDSYYAMFAAQAADTVKKRDNVAVSPRTVYGAMKNMYFNKNVSSLSYFPYLGKHLGLVKGTMQTLIKKSILSDCSLMVKEQKEQFYRDFNNKKLPFADKVEKASIGVTTIIEIYSAIKRKESIWKDDNFDLKNAILEISSEGICKIIGHIKALIVDPEMGTVESQFDAFEPAMINAWLRDRTNDDYNVNNLMLAHSTKLSDQLKSLLTQLNEVQ